MSAEHEDSLTKKYLWQIDRKTELQPSQKNLLRIKVKASNVQLWSIEQPSQTKGGKKGEGWATINFWTT